jgi:hypothetical protein
MSAYLPVKHHIFPFFDSVQLSPFGSAKRIEGAGMLGWGIRLDLGGGAIE